MSDRRLYEVKVYGAGNIEEPVIHRRWGLMTSSTPKRLAGRKRPRCSVATRTTIKPMPLRSGGAGAEPKMADRTNDH